MRKKKILFVLSFLMICLLTSAQAQNMPSSVERTGMEEAVVNVARIAGPAVVSISTERTEKIGGKRKYYFRTPFEQESPFGEQDEFFRRFFDDFFGEMPEREFKQSGLGSGVIIDQEGYILTNEHVVGDADKITVTLPDGRELKGEIKGKDMRSDLAVIKINAKNLPVIMMGDSDNLKIGQWVVAIGNPFGLDQTLSVGVIGGLGREMPALSGGTITV
jgi:serine protease Do